MSDLRERLIALADRVNETYVDPTAAYRDLAIAAARLALEEAVAICRDQSTAFLDGPAVRRGCTSKISNLLQRLDK